MTQQRRFTKEFEEEAVRLVQTSGRTQREIAGDLRIGYRRWIGRSRDRRAIDPSAAESDLTAELKRLRWRLVLLIPPRVTTTSRPHRGTTAATAGGE